LSATASVRDVAATARRCSPTLIDGPVVGDSDAGTATNAGETAEDVDRTADDASGDADDADGIADDAGAIAADAGETVDDARIFDHVAVFSD
jgi:hypothetical protein